MSIIESLLNLNYLFLLNNIKSPDGIFEIKLY